MRALMERGGEWNRLPLRHLYNTKLAPICLLTKLEKNRPLFYTDCAKIGLSPAFAVHLFVFDKKICVFVFVVIFLI